MSDRYLFQRPANSPIPRNLTTSAPEMSYTRDADGFAVPPIPNSSQIASIVPSDFTGATPDSGPSSARGLVEDPHYRRLNLSANKICLRPLHGQLPEHIADLVDFVVREDRASPGPSPDQIWQDAELNELWMGSGEPEVEEYFGGQDIPEAWGFRQSKTGGETTDGQVCCTKCRIQA
jgi:hypothetical protein